MITSALKTFWQEEDGQDMVEYCLLLAFIALAAVAVLGNVKTQVGNLWSTVNTSLSNANSAAS